MVAWVFYYCIIFDPTWENDPSLTNMFRMGWNQHLADHFYGISRTMHVWIYYSCNMWSCNYLKLIHLHGCVLFHRMHVWLTSIAINPWCRYIIHESVAYDACQTFANPLFDRIYNVPYCCKRKDLTRIGQKTLKWHEPWHSRWFMRGSL